MSDDQHFGNAVREFADEVGASFTHDRLAIGYVRGFCSRLLHS